MKIIIGLNISTIRIVDDFAFGLEPVERPVEIEIRPGTVTLSIVGDLAFELEFLESHRKFALKI